MAAQPKRIISRAKRGRMRAPANHLQQMKSDLYGGRHNHRLAARQRRLKAPLLYSLDRGLIQAKSNAVDNANVRRASINPNIDPQLHDALQLRLARRLRILWLDLMNHD